MIEQQTAQAQQVLDELLSKKLIPFALTAYSVITSGRGEYVVAFNDSLIQFVSAFLQSDWRLPCTSLPSAVGI